MRGSYLPESGGLFNDVRFIAYSCIAACSTVVLGISGHFAAIFLPHIHREFLIFALVASATTIVVLSTVLLRSQPRWDVFVLFVLAAVWVAMGSWSADIIAHIECESLGNDVIPIKNNGTTSYQVYCREMKVILAFSWSNFVLLALAFAVLIALIIRVLSYGRKDVWEESISEVPWFNQWNYPHEEYGRLGQFQMGQGQGQYPYPYMSGQPIQTGPNQYVVQQAPGHSVVVGNPAYPGGAPTVQQVPA